jgi:glycosyltransferase involved in cell wall biosynthesis
MSHKGKKVLFLCSWYPNRKNPTLGNFVQKHAEAASLLNEVVVLAIIADETINSIEVVENRRGEMNEVLVYFPKKKAGFLSFSKLRSFLSYRKAFDIGMKRVAQLVGSPDIVHLNVIYPLGYFALKFKRKTGTPFVISEHASGFQNGSNSYSRTVIWMAKKVLNVSDCVMPVSKDLGNRLKQLSPNITIKVIPNVVNEAIFIPSEELDVTNKFVHISNAFEPAKNVLGILRAVHNLSKVSSNFSFHIISDGDVTKAHQLARELGVLNSFVFFYPTMSTVEIANFVKKCRALVLFSNFENFPCVIPEAFMAGIPVIATAVNGIPEYINESNGILIQAKDETGLLAAFKSLIDSQSFHKEKLRAYAMEHFSYAAVGKSISDVYEKVLR